MNSSAANGKPAAAAAEDRREADSVEAILDRVLAPKASYYEVLGVDSMATTSQIRAAYKKLALKLHPDKYQGDRKEDAETAFKRIASAVEVLCDEQQRSAYDADLASASSSSAFSSSSTSHTGWSAFQSRAATPAFDCSSRDSLYGIFVFLSQVRQDLRENPNADMSEAFPLILLGVSHVALDLVAFMASNCPTLLFTLGLVGFFGGMIAGSDRIAAALQALEWSKLPPSVRSMLLDVLVAFYKQKLDALSRSR